MPKLPGGIIRALIVFIFLLIPLTFFAKEIKAASYDQPSLNSVNDDIRIIRNAPAGSPLPINATGINSMQVNLLMLNLSRSIGCTDLAKAKGIDPFEECKKTTALGYIATTIGTIYANPPASFRWYAEDFLAHAGLGPNPVYAQGIGFTGLKPLLPLWTTARNISYTILVIVMVVIGFMIIFRMKIDPKTVISVQAALPKIIVTLLLITFSYAIAGFLIDLMYVVIAMVVTILSNAVDKQTLAGVGIVQTNFNTNLQLQDFMTGDWTKLWGSVMNPSLLPAFLAGFFGGSIQNIALLGGASVASVLIGVTSLSLVGWPVVAAAAFPAAVLIFIIFLGLLFTFIRLFLLLLNSYIQVIIGVILGPVLLLQEAIPGKSAFSSWLLNLMANLSVFPATIAIIYSSWIITATAMTGNLWGPPLLLGSGGNGSGNPLSIIIGLGMIFLAPNLVVSVKKVFQPKPTLPITAGTMLSPLTGGISTTMGAASQFYYMQQALGTGALAGVLQRFGIGEKKPK